MRRGREIRADTQSTHVGPFITRGVLQASARVTEDGAERPPPPRAGLYDVAQAAACPLEADVSRRGR